MMNGGHTCIHTHAQTSNDTQWIRMRTHTHVHMHTSNGGQWMHPRTYTRAHTPLKMGSGHAYSWAHVYTHMHTL